MDASSRLQTIDATLLTAPVRQALRSDAAKVQEWQLSQLGGGAGNPVSVGLFRYLGTALDCGRRLPWSLILKVIQSPANEGWANMGEGDDQTHWNYWKRELFIYRLGLLDSLPAGLRAPRCFGQAEFPGNVAWLWLEEVTDAYGGSWPLDRYASAAFHLGRLNGCYLGERPLPSVSWLSQSLLRQWLMLLSERASRFFDSQSQPSIWEHPLVLQRFPKPEVNSFRRMLMESVRFLAALDRLPQTLCHGDTYPTNLMWSKAADGHEQLVALDWALMGIGPLGADLGQLVQGACVNLQEVEQAEVEQVLFEAYLEGLRKYGWQGNARLVQFGFKAYAALRAGLFGLYWLNEALERNETSRLEAAGEDAGNDKTESPVAPASFEVRMAEEAYRLLAFVR